MDHGKVVKHMVMAEGTGAAGDQKKAIVMNILMCTGLIKSEAEKVAAGLAIDAIVWAANHPREIGDMVEQGKVTCVTCFGGCSRKDPA